MRLSTTDQTAVAVMLSGVSEQTKHAGIDSLQTDARITHGLQCPDCESVKVSDNGLRGVDLTFLCEDCGHQWSPNL